MSTPPTSVSVSVANQAHAALRAEADEESGKRTFEYRGWKVETCKKPILNAKDSDALADALGIPLPEICFGHNSLTLTFLPPPTSSPSSAFASSPSPSSSSAATPFVYSFSTPPALDRVDKSGSAPGTVKVSYAEEWLKGKTAASPLSSPSLQPTTAPRLGDAGAAATKGEGAGWASSTPRQTVAGGRSPAGLPTPSASHSQPQPEPQMDTTPAESGFKVVKPFDWTFTSTFSGSSSAPPLFPSSPSQPTASSSSVATSAFSPAPPGHPGIPLERLTVPDPILFFEEVTLFEDELHDNGMSSLVVKLRVMPSCLFLLSRFFLRVDGVLFRLFDTRVFHSFGSDEVIRETRGKEESYEEVKRKLPRDKPHDLTPLTDPNWVASVLGMLKPPSPSPSSSAASREEGKGTGWQGQGRWLDVAKVPLHSSTS